MCDAGGGCVHNEFECYYKKEKPERDRVRDKVWQKLETNDDVTKKTYEALENFQREIRAADSAQDRHIEELKAMLQEVAAAQNGTDEEMQQVKMQIGTLRSDIADLKYEIGNGMTEKLGNDITDKLFKLLEIASDNNFSMRRTEKQIEIEKEKAKAARKKLILTKTLEIIGTALTSGGIIYLILERTS
jgi:prophage DNA circulation protein